MGVFLRAAAGEADQDLFLGSKGNISLFDCHGRNQWNMKFETSIHFNILVDILKGLFILGIYFSGWRKVNFFCGNNFHGYALKP